MKGTAFFAAAAVLAHLFRYHQLVFGGLCAAVELGGEFMGLPH